jgi:PPOX class probable F420-dependent enzyme
LDSRKSRSLLEAARVARLGTINAKGLVDLVPVTFAVADDAIVTAVDHKPKTTTALQRLRNVRRHGTATLLVDEYDEDWTALWWVRVRGAATVIEPDVPGHRAAVAPLVAKYEQYHDRAPRGAAIVVRIDEITGWAAGGDC